MRLYYRLVHVLCRLHWLKLQCYHISSLMCLVCIANIHKLVVVPLTVNLRGYDDCIFNKQTYCEAFNVE